MRITRRKADDLLSGSIPLLNASGRIVPDRLVSDVLTTYMRGSGIGPAGVMVMLDIADDARVSDQAALDNCVSVNSYGHLPTDSSVNDRLRTTRDVAAHDVDTRTERIVSP
jgi:hypothetical protein